MKTELSLTQGRRADTIWTEQQYKNLLWHLHGGNAADNFIAGFIGTNVKSGLDEPIFRRNRSRKIPNAIDSTWEALCGNSPRPYAVVLLADPTPRQSTWVVWDFDFHDPTADALGGIALRDLRAFIREAAKLSKAGICYIVEHSGRGWHCWLVADSSHSESEWKAIRKRVESKAAFACPFEFLPGFNGEGQGCRAPGSANPNTWHATREDWQTSLIFWETVSQSRLELNRKEVLLYSSSGTLERAEPDASSQFTVSSLLERFRVTATGTRHNQLLRLVGEGCFHFGREVLREAAHKQFEQASPLPKATLGEHLQDFEEAYDGCLEKLVFPRLSQEELAIYLSFNAPRVREVFLIAQNYARRGRGKFFFSTMRVAECVGLSFQRIAQIREQFADQRIIEKLPGSFVPGLKAHWFKWLPPMLGSRLPATGTVKIRLPRS